MKDVAESYDCREGLTIPQLCIFEEDPPKMTIALNVDESYGRFLFFKQWFGENVAKAAEDTCSESLFLIPMFAGD